MRRAAFLVALVAHGLIPSAVIALAQGSPDTAPDSAALRIPLCPGLTIVTAIRQADGDYESIKTIQSVSDEAVRLKYSSEKMDYGDMLSTEPPRLKRTVIYRVMRREDLASANSYLQQFYEKLPEMVRGTTAIGTSAAVLEALKTQGETELGIYQPFFGDIPLDENGDPVKLYVTPMVAKVRRVGTTAVMLPVLVNDRRVELPAIRAEGDFFGWKSEFFFLDDPQNPLTLKFRIDIGGIEPLAPEMKSICEGLERDAPETVFTQCMRPEGGDRDVLQVVKISHRCVAAPAPAVPQVAAGELTPPSAEFDVATEEPSLPLGAGGAPGDVVQAPAGETVQQGDPSLQRTDVEVAALELRGAGGAAPVTVLEEALLESGRAEVYDIFFTFNSDSIREESEPRLGEIAEVMQRHPDWKLSVEGHTDAVASESYNLELSQRRAAAVKDALVTRYGIATERLTTAGYGESRPRDTNETLEGRAHNRRVELVRQP